MYHGKEKMPKIKATLCTIGGIVLGTNALLAFFAMNTGSYSAESSLRDSKSRNEINPITRNTTDSYDQEPKDLYEWAFQTGSDESQTGTVGYLNLFKNSNNPYDFIVPAGTSNDGNSRSESLITERVLAEETTESSLFGPDPEPSYTKGIFTDTSSSNSTEIDHKDSLFSPKSHFENGFRLRLYWHEDYFWQERTHERYVSLDIFLFWRNIVDYGFPLTIISRFLLPENKLVVYELRPRW